VAANVVLFLLKFEGNVLVSECTLYSLYCRVVTCEFLRDYFFCTFYFGKPPSPAPASYDLAERPTLHIKRSLASCLIYVRALLVYVIFILRVRSVSKMLPSVKFPED